MENNEVVNYEVKADKLERFLKNTQSRLRFTSRKIMDDLSELALSEMSKNYSTAEFQPGEEMDFSKTGTNKEKTVSMSGAQSWYSEFGTGTRGELLPHPLKSRFNLKPYNSGETIRTASAKVAEKAGAIAAGISEGDLYWTYQAKDGNIYYTKGIPAQKIVYNAGMTVQKKIPEIVEKRIKEMFGNI